MALPAGIAALLFVIHSSGILFSAAVHHWHAYECFCFGTSLAGLFVRAYTVGHTPVGTSGRNTERQVADGLNTMDAYSVVRHPLYLGNCLMWLGIAMLTCNAAFVAEFALCYWLYYERIMFAEEQFLRRKFGAAYLDWAGRTPAFLPDFRHYRASGIAFSWKKVVKKEKNGVFALFLLFTLFDIIIVYWQVASVSLNLPLYVATAISGIAYFVLKYVKSHTNLLDEQGR